MSSATVIRVKRRLEENPQDALVLVCKKAKTDSEISPSLFVFRATVENQEDNNKVKDILPKTDRRSKTSAKLDAIIEKIRKERKELSNEKRYEVVNCSRGLAEGPDKKFDIIDLVQKVGESEDVGYAYDLYTLAKPGFDVSMLDNLVSIENYESELVFGSFRDNGLLSASSSENEESDDSNDENNWRNDYPDSEHSSIDEEAMIKAVERIGLEDDLSSDDGEDKIYEDNTMFNEDVKRYGEAYAKYKARVLAEPNGDPEGTVPGKTLIHYAKDMDEENIDGYKDDSDDGFYYGQEENTEQFKDQYKEDSESDFDPD